MTEIVRVRFWLGLAKGQIKAEQDLKRKNHVNKLDFYHQA